MGGGIGGQVGGGIGGQVGGGIGDEVGGGIGDEVGGGIGGQVGGGIGDEVGGGIGDEVSGGIGDEVGGGIGDEVGGGIGGAKFIYYCHALLWLLEVSRSNYLPIPPQALLIIDNPRIGTRLFSQSKHTQVIFQTFPDAVCPLQLAQHHPTAGRAVLTGTFVHRAKNAS